MEVIMNFIRREWFLFVVLVTIAIIFLLFEVFFA